MTKLKIEDVRLGRVQKEVLRCLISHGEWHKHCGWVWTSHVGTTKLCESLVRRGVATEIVKTIRHARSGNSYKIRSWVPSNFGRRWYEANKGK